MRADIADIDRRPGESHGQTGQPRKIRLRNDFTSTRQRSPSVVYDIDPNVPADALFLEHEDDGGAVSIEVFPRAEIRILTSSGHWPFADDPDSVAQVVLPFLRQQLQRPA